MIEKLEGMHELENVASYLQFTIIPKINEMIDAINKLEQHKRTTTKCRNCGHHEVFDEACFCNHEYGKLQNHLDICYGNQKIYCQYYED